MIQSSNPKTTQNKSKIDETLEDLLDNTNEIEVKNLRPNAISDYIGQNQIVKQLKIILDSARIREKLPDHLLFYGPPGLGKTTLASLIANEMQIKFKIVSAPAIQKSGDIISLLLNLEDKTILFIDEIHRLKAPIEEILYTAMEDKMVDVVLGKGAGAISTRMELADFTLVGATTKLGKLSKPLQDRFTTIFQLHLYEPNEIQKIIERNVDILGLKIDFAAMVYLSKYCRGTPRVANNLLRRLLDFQVVHKLESIDKGQLIEFLDELGIYENGLTRQDMQYLEALKNNTSLGVKTLAGILLEEVDTLEEVREPYLIHLGLIDKSVEGRRLTLKGKEFVGESSFRSSASELW
jgi:Holliday junction DNA helicase RuvB